MSAADAVAIPSTGQTYADLIGLEKLYRIYMEHDKMPTQETFQLPALRDLNYRPDTHYTINLSFASTAIILTTFFFVCRLSVRFTSLNNNNGRKLLSEDWFLVAAYVCVPYTARVSNLANLVTRFLLWLYQ